jgi:hypothetical protein
VEQRQPVLLEGDEAAVAGQTAQPDDVLDLATGILDREPRQLAEQIGEVERRELLDIGIAERVDRIGDVEATLFACRAGDDDVGAGYGFSLGGIGLRGITLGGVAGRVGSGRGGGGGGRRRRLRPGRRLCRNPQRDQRTSRTQAVFCHDFFLPPD